VDYEVEDTTTKVKMKRYMNKEYETIESFVTQLNRDKEKTLVVYDWNGVVDLTSTNMKVFIPFKVLIKDI
jgi:peptidyl-tRNA hydrolase